MTRIIVCGRVQQVRRVVCLCGRCEVSKVARGALYGQHIS